MKNQQIINIPPFPAVRSNKNSWSPRTKKYHAQMDYLRLITNDKENIIKALISGNYDLVFRIKTPNSWSKKKKEEYILKPHQQKPDIDNLFKAFTDTLFYNTEYNDSKISLLRARKIWWSEGCIEINY